MTDPMAVSNKELRAELAKDRKKKPAKKREAVVRQLRDAMV